ncbi:hypothetical protein HD554DRAFT_2021588, partial [Boletus coccyginus]
KNHEDDVYGRYLLTFVNRDAADEWWRMISTQPSPWTGKIKRISPQFYTDYPTSHELGIDFFSHDDFPAAREFLDKMFFTLLNDRDGRILSIAPPIKIMDHISDRWYFIRSQSDTQKYWYFRVDGTCLVCGNADCDAIHVSTQFRSRFCIRARIAANQSLHAPRGFVMIGSDDIHILASKDYTLRINDEEDLKATKNQETSDLLFSDLKDRFLSRAEAQGNRGVIYEYVVPVERGLGQAWELVD